jgi:hypothetical protein
MAKKEVKADTLHENIAASGRNNWYGGGLS